MSVNELPVLEDKDGRDNADVVLSGYFGVVVHVQFADYDVVAVFARNFFDDGSNSTAGTGMG